MVPAFLRIPYGIVMSEMHELVEQIRLVQVGSQRAQLFVCRKVSSEMRWYSFHSILTSLCGTCKD